MASAFAATILVLVAVASVYGCAAGPAAGVDAARLDGAIHDDVSIAPIDATDEGATVSDDERGLDATFAQSLLAARSSRAGFCSMKASGCFAEG